MKELIRHAAPEMALVWYRQIRLSAQAAVLRKRMAQADTPEEWTALLASAPAFRPLQKPGELIELLRLVRSVGAARICEIGTAAGGTLCGLARAARPDATVATLDLTLTAERRAAFPRFAREHQRIVCLEGNSHHASLRDQLGALLADAPLDVLFIDGDHSYQGVCRDFEMYSPLVREGGVIVLHDIVPDDRQRYGTATTAETGGVPRFWSELKRRFGQAREIIDDPNQNGYGLGVLSRSLCA